MKKRVAVTDVARNFADFINRVAYRGEEFILERGGKSVAELNPAIVGEKLGSLVEFIDSLPRLSDLDRNDLLASQKAGTKTRKKEVLRDPWA